MIENMRKYTGLMVVVFILLGAGFLFTMNDIGTGGGGAGGGSGPKVLEFYGQSIDEQEYNRRGNRTLELATELGLVNYVNFLLIPNMELFMQNSQMVRFGLPQNYYIRMNRYLTRDDMNRFITNRTTLQRAMEEMGLYADEEEVAEFLKTSSRFAPSGQYNSELYKDFKKKRLGRLGMTEKHLYEVVRESICLDKLIQIVGTGLMTPRTAIQDQVEALSQTVTLARVGFNRDDFVEREKPTQEEVKTYWEANKDAYKTKEQRRITYILLDIPEEPKEEDKKEEDKPDTETEEKPTSETAESDAEKDRKEAEAKAKNLKEEQKKKAITAVKKDIEAISDAIIDRINNKEPLDFEAILTEHGKTPVKTELFTADAPPEALKGLRQRSTSAGGKSIVDEIFEISKGADAYGRVSDAHPVGENAWIIFRVDEVIEPKLLEFADARLDARAKLISENGTRKVKEAADQAQEKIVAAMKEGKSFDDAAKALDLIPVQVGPYALNGIPPKNEPSYRQLHRAASGLNIGDVSKAIHENDRSVIIFVEKREIEDTEENKNRVDFGVTNSKVELTVRTFLSWRNAQFDKAKVSGSFTESN